MRMSNSYNNYMAILAFNLAMNEQYDIRKTFVQACLYPVIERADHTLSQKLAAKSTVPIELVLLNQYKTKYKSTFLIFGSEVKVIIETNPFF